VVPQAIWFKRVRHSALFLFILSILVNVGMWTERFVIVTVSLTRDYVPSMWGIFLPTVWDILTVVGSIGFFTALIFLFIRFLPVISISEVQEEIAAEEEGV
jgi:Ni/Fe-hydrogenase subunit HybB-like protein